jgi:hypothetical protein
MKKHLFALAMICAMGGAFATTPSNSNNSDNITNNTTNNTYNVPQGGQGGQGGSAYSSNSNKNSNKNTNSNVNKQGQAQGQDQKQNQGQAQTQNSTSKATGGNSTATGGLSSSTSEGGAVSESNNAAQSTNVTTNAPRQTASAANVTLMPTAVCSGTTAAGAQGATFGLSFGTSWTDTNCMLLEQVRTVASILEQPRIASEMMCAIDAYREARLRLGDLCITTKDTSNSGKIAVKQEEYTDPIIRARLNLPPLK